MYRNGDSVEVVDKIKDLIKNYNDLDPPVIFGWEFQELEVLLLAINNPLFIPPPGVFSPFPNFVIPTNANTLTSAILTYVRGVHNMPIIGTTALACTITEFGHVCTIADMLCHNQWIKSLNNFTPIGSIAKIYIPLNPRSNSLQRVCDDIPLDGVGLWI